MAGWPTWVILSLAILPLSKTSPVSSTPSPAAQDHETDNPHTRKLLGSSVVTSVSVIMDHGNGTKTYITDGNSHSGDSTSGQLGKPPQVVGTPGTLLSPDRYEFYTFGKEGELVKKLMTLDQIQSLIAAAGGEEDDDLSDQPVYYHQPLVEAGDTEGVNKVLESVHNVLKGELEAAAAAGQHSGEVPLLSDQSWTILLPGLFSNDMDFKETLSTASKKPIPSKPSSTPATTTFATTRFPPRKTTTTTSAPSTQQHYKPLSTSYVKPAHTTPTNKFTTPKVPLHQPSHQQQQLASSSILSPQYTSIKAPLSKPTASTSGTSTTVKYSAHYTTPHPTVPPQHTTHYVKPQHAGVVTKPAAISVKKPISSTHSSIKTTTPTTTIQTTASPETITHSTEFTTVSSSVNTTPKPTITKKTTTAPPITTYKASTTSPLTINAGIKQPIINNVPHRTTTQSPYVPTTYRPSTAHPPAKYTQSQKPSGIPTIVHYLPMHSMSPSHAPVFPTIPTNIPHENISQTQKLTTQQQSIKPTTTSPTTINDNSVISTIFEEISTTVPSTDKEFQEITVQRFPSTATIATKNHYTVINAIKSSPTTTKPMKSTQSITTNYETTIQNSEADTSTVPLVAMHTAVPIHTIADEDNSNTVSVVTIFEDTTRPMGIVTTTGKTWPTTNVGTADKLIHSTTAADLLESFTTIPSTTSTTTSRPSTRPSTIMVQISTKPPYRNNSSSSASDNHFRPISTRPAIVHRRTTTTTSPPPRRGSVSYTPLPQVYKSTPSSLRQPIKTTAASSIHTKTTSRPSVATVEQHRPTITTTASTTKKPAIASTTSPTITTESTTTTSPSETTTYLAKIPLEQLPMKLIENLKDTNKQTIYEMPSTVDIENYSTAQKLDSSTMSTTETSTAETTYITAPTLTTFPAKIVIVNNSEPFIVNHSLSEQDVSRLPVSEALTLTQSTPFTSLPSTIEYSTMDSETTTMEPVTTYKDQILEEGINAVTSILLDGEQKKEFLLNMTRPLGLFNNTFITTTEDDQYVTNITEEITTTQLVPLSEEKSETRLDEVELTENYEDILGTMNVMSTTQGDRDVSNVDEDLLQMSTQKPVHNQVKKHIPNEIKSAISEEAKIEDKKTNNTRENSTVESNEQEIKNQHPGKPNEPQNINQSKVNNTELSEKLASSEESKKTVHTKPILQEIIKKPTQQEIKKQPTDEVKRPSLTKTKPTNQKPVQEKVNNSTKESVKETSKDEGDDDTKIPVKLEIKGQTGDDTKKPHIVPTKESKLNPDMVDEPNQMVEIQQDPSDAITAATLNTATTATSERPIVHEQIKLQEVDKNVNGFNKFNSKRPVYQPPPQELSAPPAAIDLHPAPYESMGLEASTAFLAEDIRRFADLCNELAFKLWSSLTSKGQISSRSLVMSPFAVTSLLAMVFLGARGATSGQMNDILRLDDMVTFNPHQVFQNVTDSVLNSKTKGVSTAAFIRELYSDKSKGKLLDFYKERAQQYYQGHVEEINFSTVGDIIRRRTNLLIKRQTLGKVAEYLRGSSLNMKPPLAAFSANIFQTDCELGSTEGRDGEMYFVVRPSTRQRRLVPVPAVVWRQGFLAGYEPSLDATSVCLGADSVVSTILILPGQQGQVAPGDGLARLEQRLIETNYRRGAWSRLLRSQLSRPGLELQVPRFSHRSVLNVTGALTRMGLRDLFGTKADLRGLNGLSNDLHLSDMVQVNTFSTCGEETVGARHHIETYPASPQRTGRDEPDSQSSVTDVLHDYSHNMQQWDSIPLALRPRQARLPDNPRLRFDRPFLYVVRHNPSGIILHMGRFNPRLLP